MYEFLFLDMDDTILDFHKAESLAIAKTLQSFGLTPTPEILSRYSAINARHWEMLERREIGREQVLVGRFQELFREYGIEEDPEKCARCYEANLSQGHFFMPGAVEALERLSKRYKLYLASNGTLRVQQGRLESANISHYFQNIFISEAMGANKPALEFFINAFANIPSFDPGKAMIAGDSLTSDILGGKNAGIATCWVNTQKKPGREDILPDYEISCIGELEGLLERLQ